MIPEVTLAPAGPVAATPEPASGNVAAEPAASPLAEADTLQVSVPTTGAPVIDNRLRFPAEYAGLQQERDYNRRLAVARLDVVRRLLQATPSLVASRSQRESYNGFGVTGSGLTQTPHDPAKRVQALSQAMQVFYAGVSGSAGYGVTDRQQVMSILTAGFSHQQADVLSRLLTVRSAHLDAIRSQALLDVFEGRLGGDAFAATLTARLVEESRLSDDMVKAVLAPMGIFLAGSQAFFDAVSRSTRSAIDSLVRQTTAQLVATGYLQPRRLPLVAPVAGETPPLQQRVTLGAMYVFAQERVDQTYAIAEPGRLTLALWDWQELGIIGPGEMALVVDRISGGMPAPGNKPGPSATVSERLTDWANRQNAVLMTPSIIARLVPLIERPGGVIIDGETVTPANLATFLEKLRLPTVFLRAAGIDTRSLVGITVSTTRDRRQASAVAVGGDLLAGNAGALSQDWAPSAGVGFALNTGRKAESSVTVEIEHGARRVKRVQQTTSGGIGVVGGASNADGGRVHLGTFFSF